ncbi:MAG: hypothetical protein LBL93_04685 [Ruminococcus sp.]|jgi:uncharacterized ubiquitin-like protein YukD|nr:hypothetical protein [Ruminococcus sp.]
MKLKFLSLALAMVILFAFASCNEKEKSVNDSGTNAVTTYDLGSVNSSHTAGSFDFNDAINNIYLDGKKISFPETAEDILRINKKYNLESEGDEYSDYGLTMVQVYSGDHSPENIIVELFYDFEHYPKLNDKIEAIYFSEDLIGNGVYDFRIGDTISEKEIIDFFGEPTEKTISAKETVRFKYEKDKNHYLRFTITKENVLSVIEISNGLAN